MKTIAEIVAMESVTAVRTAGDGGAFIVKSKRFGKTFRVICSIGGGWDHVSVSLPNRVPRWEEMEFIRHLFFNPDEIVMQLHVPRSVYVNVHENCLHLWRPHVETIPVPPIEFV